jgi:hypothetical protein
MACSASSQREETRHNVDDEEALRHKAGVISSQDRPYLRLTTSAVRLFHFDRVNKSPSKRGEISSS